MKRTFSKIRMSTGSPAKKGYFGDGFILWTTLATTRGGFASLLLMILSLLSACGSQAATPARGSLGVTISGLPSNLSANVTVSGPGGFSQSLSAGQTLGNLEPGTYTLTAASVSASGLIYTASISGSPATVEASKFATANVTYALQNPGGTGGLSIRVNGLPEGLTPELVVRGPGGTFPLRLDQPLQNLVPGVYAVTASPLRQSDTTVDTIFDGTAVTVTVTGGAIAVADINFAPRIGTGLLWVSSEASATGFGFRGYTAAALNSSGNPAPSLRLAQAFGDLLPTRFVGLALDATRLWTTARSFDLDPDNHGVVAFSLSQAGVPVVRPSVLIRGASTNTLLTNVTRLGGLAFDQSGNLWVVSIVNQTLVKFSPEQLKTGTPTPAVALDLSDFSATLFTGSQQAGLAFDTQGNLWFGSNARIIKLTPSQLSTSGKITQADVTVRLFNDGRRVNALAFDAIGNLWVASSGRIAQFSVAQLSQAGPDETANPAPLVTLTLGQNVNNSATPFSLAFDNGGNLWAGTGAGTIVRLTPEQLTASGTITPSVAIETGSGVAINGLAFAPAPANLPLIQPGLGE